MINSSNYENKKKLGIPFFAVPNTFKHFTDPVITVGIRYQEKY